MKTKACLIANLDHETRKTRTRTQHGAKQESNKILLKNRQNKAMIRKHTQYCF
jgi:hypothetical protein